LTWQSMVNQRIRHLREWILNIMQYPEGGWFGIYFSNGLCIYLQK